MRKLIISVVVFVLLLVPWSYLGLAYPDASGLRSPTWEAARITLQTLLWLSGALSLVLATNLFFWDYSVARIVKRPVPPMIKSTSTLAIFVVALTGIIGVVFGRDVTGIWATSSAIGVVLGFALRATLQDVFSGIAMNLDGSLKAGDWIEFQQSNASRYYGCVVDIGWRATQVNLENGNAVIVPNSVMGSTAVTNYARGNHVSRFEEEIVLDFELPSERARRILEAGMHAAASNGIILATPAAEVLIGEPTDRGVAYRLRYWGRVTDHSPARMRDAVLSRALRDLAAVGIAPALPKEDVAVSRQQRRLLDHVSGDDRRTVLARIQLFRNALDEQELSLLAQRVVPSFHSASATLVRQGENGDSMFVLVEGFLEVAVLRPDAERPVVVNHIAPGQVFGEMSLLTQAPRSATVTAVTDVVVYEITHGDFDELLSSRPAMAEQFSLMVARHRVRTDAMLYSAGPTEIERETRRLKDEIMDRMATIFRGILGRQVRSRTGS